MGEAAIGVTFGKCDKMTHFSRKILSFMHLAASRFENVTLRHVFKRHAVTFLCHASL